MLYIIIIILLCVSKSLISKKININKNSIKKYTKIKIENTTRPKLPPDFLKNEAIIFNNIIKNNSSEKNK
jgi:hypothetical protein